MASSSLAPICAVASYLKAIPAHWNKFALTSICYVECLPNGVYEPNLIATVKDVLTFWAPPTLRSVRPGTSAPPARQMVSAAYMLLRNIVCDCHQGVTRDPPLYTADKTRRSDSAVAILTLQPTNICSRVHSNMHA